MGGPSSARTQAPAGRTGRPPGESDRERRLALLLALCVAATLSLGVAKLFVQRAHPPDWATANNRYEGFVSIDRYCERAERFRDWLVGNDPGGRRLAEHLREGGHANAVLVPGMVALVSLVTGSIVASFAFLSGTALVLQVVLVGLLARQLVPEAPGIAGLLSATLTAAHCDSARTAAQLVLDPFTAVFATLVVLAALRWLERRDARGFLVLLAALFGACFVKLSALPVLCAPVLLALVSARARRSSAVAVALAVGMLLLLSLRVCSHLALQEPVLAAEIGEMWTRNAPTRESISNFLVEMALLFQFVPVVLAGGARALGREALGTLLVAAAFLLTVLFRLNDDARLYLPVLGLALAGSTPALLRVLPPRWIVRAAAMFAGVNLSVAGLALVSSAA